jgi:O-methyltransferase
MIKKLKNLLKTVRLIQKMRSAVTLFTNPTAIVLPNVKFTGWGIASKLSLPTVSDQIFADRMNSLNNAINDGSINISQFGNIQNQLRLVKSLTWRYYLVYSSVFFVSTDRARRDEKLVMIEFGVADGITASFACVACEKIGADFDLLLYDSFDTMLPENLTESEMVKAGAYAHLNDAVTVANIKKLSKHAKPRVCKGYLPDSFKEHQLPSKIDWVSIDLNSSSATLAVLNELNDRLSVGSVMVFDDYGHNGFEETMRVVLQWVSSSAGAYRLIHLPSGQCLIVKVSMVASPGVM